MNRFINNHLYKNLLLIHAYSCHCVTTNLNKGKKYRKRLFISKYD